MNYPGHIVKIGEADVSVVRALRKRLSERGQPNDLANPVFDGPLKSLVKLFQAQNHDPSGLPLNSDGEVGPITWASLFGAALIQPVARSAAEAALAKAITQIGVMEKPPGSNRGPEVEAYLKSTGLGGGNFWCMAFVHWCFREANGATNPFPKTAGCLDAWNRVGPSRQLSKLAARANPALVKPGMVFILDFGGGHGHTGFVRSNQGGALRTVEGNSDPGGSSNGIGVFELSRRNVMNPSLRGFIDFTR